MTHPMDPVDLETPEADAAEQATVTAPGWQEAEGDARPLAAEANEWDAQEQGRIVEFDDDYR
jgi:hypothetical protein